MTTGSLVLGLGNPLRRDEGAGLAALQRLAARRTLPAGVRLVAAGTPGLALLDEVEGASRVLVLDAVLAGQPPGTMVRLEGDAVPATMGRHASAHDLALPDALALLGLLDRAPCELVVLGVQPASIDPGEGLSEPVAAALDLLVDEAEAQLARWEAEPCTS